MATFDDDLLSKEELDNIDNDNQGDDDSMKVVLTMKRWRKFFKLVKKEVDELNEMPNMRMILKKPFVKMSIFETHFQN